MSIQSGGIIQNEDGTCKIVGEERAPLPLKPDTLAKFSFTYEVEWVSSDIEWASRWDIYLNTSDGQIHWFSIINSIIIIIFLTGSFPSYPYLISSLAVMAVILLKTLRRDIASYNREEDSVSLSHFELKVHLYCRRRSLRNQGGSWYMVTSLDLQDVVHYWRLLLVRVSNFFA